MPDYRFPSSTRIDMALTQGVPSFMQVLEVVTTEMQVEAAVIAEEIKTHNPQLHATLLTHLEQLQQHREIPLKFVTPAMSSSKTNRRQSGGNSQRECSRLRISFSVPASRSEVAVMEALLQLKGIDKAFPASRRSPARR